MLSYDNTLYEADSCINMNGRRSKIWLQIVFFPFAHFFHEKAKINN